jgi:hypothetical protein
LTGRKIAIVVLDNSAWRMVRQHLGKITDAVTTAKPGSYVEVEIPFK